MRRTLLSSALLLLVACQKPAVGPVPTPSPAPAPQAAKPGILPMLPPVHEGDLPCDPKDRGPLLIGPTSREKILAHRPIYKNNTDAAVLTEAWKTTWQTFDAPVVIVAAFGSWCGDSQREMPDMLALDALGNSFITVHYLGVYRDKKSKATDWPAGIQPETVAHVPTFWLYAKQPGGGMKLLDAIVENPPKPGQRMAAAVLEMLEKAR